MVAHKGPASLRPRCTQSGSSVAAIPVQSNSEGSNKLPDDGRLLPKLVGASL
jgi:hypothetical protein